MGTICVSLTPILRCVGLSRLESAILLGPPALGLVFALTLPIIKRGVAPWLLAFEGILYLMIAVLDLLSHLIQFFTGDAFRFKASDIVVGATSALPLLLYMLFLYVFTTNKVLPDLPRRFQRISKYILALFIPTVLAADQVGSFLGVSYRMVPTNSGHAPLVALGFSSDLAEEEWQFANSLCLALITVYQALCFSFAFYRLIRAFVRQRNIELANNVDNESVLFRGIGWIALGIKLGAIETVLGFVTQSFTMALIRRGLRSLGRACLIIGVVKGIDTLENFQIYDAESARDLKSRIGSPDPSSFQRVGASADRRATAISLIQRRMRESVFNPLSPSSLASTRSPVLSEKPNYPFLNEVAGAPWIAHVSKPSYARTESSKYSTASRVTVRQERGRAPTLDVRFSGLDMPSPGALTADIESRLEADERSPRSLPSPRSPPRTVSEWTVSPADVAPPPPGLAWVHPYANPELTVPDEVELVPRTAPLMRTMPVPSPPPMPMPIPMQQQQQQFGTFDPNARPRVLRRPRSSTISGGERPSLERRGTRGSSMRSGPWDLAEFTNQFPPLPGGSGVWRPRASSGPERGPSDVAMRADSGIGIGMGIGVSNADSIVLPRRATDDVYGGVEDGDLGEEQVIIAPRKSANALPSSGLRTGFMMSSPQSAQSGAARARAYSRQLDAFDDDEDEEEPQIIAMPSAVRATNGGTGMPWTLAQMGRVKTVGQAPMRNTPTPTSDGSSPRRSIPIEQFEFVQPGSMQMSVRGLPQSVTSSPADYYGPNAI